jgi:hypothetical protein
VRPDIFGELGLQNLNTKARENAVYLDWRTEDKAYRTSELFQVVSKLVSVQQEPTIPPPGKAWDHYFPEQLHNSFVDLLRISYFRPRDLLTALTILREVTLEKDPHKTRFTPSDLANPTFRKKYSDYLLGEIKDHLVFYYSDEDYRLFRSFFEYLGGKPKFSFSEFLRLFSRFRDAAVLKSAVLPDFMESAQSFLQFLYSLNVISFTEKLEDGGQFIRWCYRERTYSNIVPRVKEGANYEVFSGLHKALNLGSAIIGKG